MYEGLLSFRLNWSVLVSSMSLSLGGMVCLKLWRLFRWVLCVCTFRLTFHGLLRA